MPADAVIGPVLVTDTLLASGDDQLAALAGGYHLSFLVGAVFAFAAAGLGAGLLRAEKPGVEHAEATPEQAAEPEAA